VVLSDGLFKSLLVTYLRQAEDTLLKYEADAMINCLNFDRHDEAKAVETFTDAIGMAAQIFMENPMSTPLIPNWNRVISAIPDIFEMLRIAVEEDSK
jgi:glucosyl-3-phosphoglycerate synthase